MRVAISVKLMNLAKLFRKNGSRLFLVGGYVRNSVLGIDTFDIDVVGSLTLNRVKDVLKDSEYQIEIKNEFLGTGIITSQDFEAEYTTLRKETYEDGGAHKPVSVEFVSKPEIDAMRRDFTINAIYLDILKGDLLDFYGGMNDIKTKTIRAVEDPEHVFQNDGLRILRMVRFAGELGFSVDSKTFQAANANISNLMSISAERKFCELKMILDAPNKYQNISKHKNLIKGLKTLNALKIWKYFYLPIEKIKFSLVPKCEESVRFLALVIDAIQTNEPRNKELFLDSFLGVGGLNLSNENIDKIKNIVLGYQEAMKKMNNKDYFFKYFNYFPNISKLLLKKSKKIYSKYNFFYNYIINNHVAIQIKDLAVKGSDIKSAYPDIPPKRYSYILGELLSKVFDGVLKNEKAILLSEVKSYDY